MPLKVLLKTKMGSHAWKMEREESDIDWFQLYQTPTVDILKSPTGVRGESIRNKQVTEDTISHEIGHAINMIRGGNINYLVGLMSPAVDFTTPEAETLKKIIRDYPSKAIYHSANGLAETNFKKYILMGYEDTPKKRALIMRTVLFATRIIEDGVYDFRVVKPGENFSIEDIGKAFRRLREANDKSNLRKEYPKDLLYNWLYEVRRKDLREWEEGRVSKG